MLEIPVAFLIFNRPNTTRRVFKEIARAKPKKLLIVADGPRTDAEVEKCLAARAVVEQINWDCEVLMNYSEVNLGCKRRVSSGLDWVFNQCEEAIILEDDCLPHHTFFHFCAELLERYKGDERIMVISGNNFTKRETATNYSYYFARYPSIWGWATWRRAWRYFDPEMAMWTVLRETDWLHDILNDRLPAQYWHQIFEELFTRVREGKHGTEWDYIWMLSCWAQNGLAISPTVNLVSNIGFGGEATTTREIVSSMADIPLAKMIFPLQHPPYVVRDKEADFLTFKSTNPWAITPPGAYFWLRKKLLPFTPNVFRKPLAKMRVKLKIGANGQVT